MKYKNSILYLLGFPGVGKRTIATEICCQENFRLFDNHVVNNVVFPFVRVDDHTKMPEEIWNITRQIREIALNTLVDIGNRDFNYVFTNQLLHDDADDLEIYKSVENAAEQMQSCFVPVRLICDANENKMRIAKPNREVYLKARRPSLIDELQGSKTIEPDHKNTFTLDITNISAKIAATKILKEFSNIYK